MKKMLIVLATLLALVVPALGQFTLVTGTVVDPNGLPYANGTISPLLVLPGGTSPTLNGLPYSAPIGPSGLDGGGNFTIRLGDNVVLLPALTTWNFTVCSVAGTVQPAIGTGSVCFTLAVPITITGATQDISANLNAVAPALTKITFGNAGMLIVNLPVDTNIVPDGLTFVAGDQVGWAVDGVELGGDTLSFSQYLGVALDDSTSSVVRVQMFGVVPVKLTTAVGVGVTPVSGAGLKIFPSPSPGHDGEFEAFANNLSPNIPYAGIALSAPDGFNKFDAFLVPSFMDGIPFSINVNGIPLSTSLANNTTGGSSISVSEPVPNGTVVISSTDQKIRVPYTITAADTLQGFAAVPVVWTTPFPDNNNTVTWSLEDLTGGPIDTDFAVLDMHAKTAAGFTAVFLTVAGTDGRNVIVHAHGSED